MSAAAVATDIPLPSDLPLRVRSIRARVFRHPLSTPVVTSFGTMHDRPMVLIEVEDADGVRGWGEVWCNFPSVGAEHRARLVASVLTPIVTSRQWESPQQVWQESVARTRVLALQSGEPGPLAQAIAGVDIALWDLAARRAGKPLWRLLGGRAPTIPVYASGLNPSAPEKLAARRRDEGHRAFKLKVGFGIERDESNLRALRATLGDDARLMIDANQAWEPAEALRAAARLAAHRLEWLEEPLRADTPWPRWQELAASARIPLAGGENLASDEDFDAAIAARAFAVVQPDIAKWGGFSGCVPLARRIVAAGLRFCPHYLGGGIGQLAAAHLLAAVGGDGLLEIDSNDNPLRTDLCGPVACVVDGSVTLPEAHGLGIEPELAAIEALEIEV